MIVFLNGKFLPEEEAHIAPTDRGFTLGDGIFDTLLAVDGMVQHGDRHFERLARHAAVIDLSVPKMDMPLEKIAQRLLAENGFSTGSHAVRTTVTRGSGLRGLAPAMDVKSTFLMRASPVAATPTTPLNVIISEITCRNEHSPLSRIKAVGYGDNLLALQEAKAAGADDAILLNTSGNVACATTGNVFALVDGEWLTPPLSDGVIDGVQREQNLRNGAMERTIARKTLESAIKIYLSNSLKKNLSAKILG